MILRLFSVLRLFCSAKKNIRIGNLTFKIKKAFVRCHGSHAEFLSHKSNYYCFTPNHEKVKISVQSLRTLHFFTVFPVQVASPEQSASGMHDYPSSWRDILRDDAVPFVV